MARDYNFCDLRRYVVRYPDGTTYSRTMAVDEDHVREKIAKREASARRRCQAMQSGRPTITLADDQT